ncbi:hypothetical protein ACTFIV_004853 [Dictyostelium citrinum]
MKLNFIKLIVFNIILFINFISGYEYINFIPFSNSECSGDVSNKGVGYSVVVDTCFTLDNSTNHIIQLKGENTVVWKDFYDVQGTADCMVPIEQPTQQAEIGQCIEADFTFNSFLKPITQESLYYLIYKSSEPALQSNSYVTTFMSDSCDDDQVLLAQYIMNDTQIAYGSKANQITFFCDQKTKLPYTQFCPPGSDGSCFPPISTSLTCFETIPFFNSSSDELPSTNGGGSGSVVSTGNPSIGGSVVSSSGYTSINTDSGGSSGSINTGVVDTGGSGTGSGTGAVTSGDDGDSGSTGGGSIVSSGRLHDYYRGGGNGVLRNNYNSDKFKSESIKITKPAVFLSSSSYQASYYTSIYCE